jgi:hypothetical protein
MTNQDFKKQLENLMQSDNSLRPFVCDGDPLKCDIFIVGINPATKMETSFWDYYGEAGFDKTKWLVDYKESRKEKRTILSPTRKKIEYLVDEKFSEYRCLETNIFSAPSINLKSLDNSLKSTEIFNFLIKTIRPKAIFIHGSNPAEFIKKEFNVRFQPLKPVLVEYETNNAISPYVFEWQFGKMAICATRHLRLMHQEEITNAADGLLKKMNDRKSFV